MTIKRYKCNIGNFSFSVVIGGKQKWLNFSGSKSHEGYYSTGNMLEQRAIESSRRYLRGDIRCVGSYELSEPTMEEVASTSAPSVEEVEVVSEVTTVQAAREWLIAHRDAKSSDLGNKESVLSYAESHGVIFVNLK